MLAHPLPPAVAAAVDDYARALRVSERMVHAARELATQHLLALHADIERSTWYTNQKVHGTLHGQFLEFVRSKLAYTGLVGDQAIARRWEALRSCPPGSWGKGVADFYDRHGFPFPGEPKGIEETGAKHDFVHVLADYDATPIGEIEVFAFIATSMRGSSVWPCSASRSASSRTTPSTPWAASGWPSPGPTRSRTPATWTASPRPSPTAGPRMST